MNAEDVIDFFNYLGTDAGEPPRDLSLKLLKAIFPTLNVVNVPVTTKLLREAWAYQDKEEYLEPYVKTYTCFELVDLEDSKLICLESQFHRSRKYLGNLHLIKKPKLSTGLRRPKTTVPYGKVKRTSK